MVKSRVRVASPGRSHARERGLSTGADLAEAIARALGRGKRHPALRTFQALRIAVNDELGELRRLLRVVPDLLQPGGRVAIISFHSLEDRMVKRAFREHRTDGRLTDTSTKPVMAGTDELRHQSPRGLGQAARCHPAAPECLLGHPCYARPGPEPIC